MKELNSKNYKKYANDYTANELNVLYNRSIWYGLNSDKFPQSDISIFEYVKSKEFVNPFENLHLKTLKDIYDPVAKCAEDYANWCISHHHFAEKNIDKIIISLQDHFKGYFGERFAYYFLNNREIRVINYCGKKDIRVRFSYMIPYCKQTIGFKDYGGDFLGICEYNGNMYPCIIQSKFHNPNNKQAPSLDNMVITETYMDKIYGQGTGCLWLDQFCEDPCVFVLYTGSEQFVGKRIFDEENANAKNFAVINYQSINKTLADDTFGGVIKELNEEIEKISNFNI